MTKRELDDYGLALKEHLEAFHTVGEHLPPTLQRHVQGIASIALHLLADADRRELRIVRDDPKGGT